jgi:hypothetical protein
MLDDLSDNASIIGLTDDQAEMSAYRMEVGTDLNDEDLIGVWELDVPLVGVEFKKELFNRYIKIKNLSASLTV